MAEIEYLALEGGGGKGAAFLGAVKYLQENGHIHFLRPDPKLFRTKSRLDPTSLKGISGSSAGAITATLLASGLDFFDLQLLLLDCAQFKRIYEEQTQGENPVMFTTGRGGKSLRPSKIRLEKHKSQEHRKYFEAMWALLEKVAKPITVVELDNKFLSLDIIDVLTQNIFVDVRIALAKALKSLPFDLGLLDGEAVRNLVRGQLQRQMGNPDISFAEMYNETGIHLKITGTCLNTRETIWFDCFGPWRDMSVADAVRVSVSVPLVFKPVIVTEAPTLNYGTGTGFLFIDGGVLNNTPLHAFNFPNKAAPVTRCEAMLLNKPMARQMDRGPLNQTVLGVRLGVPTIPNIIGIDNYLSAILDIYMDRSEFSQVLSGQELQQTIALSTEGLSMLEFGICDTKGKTAEIKLMEIVDRSYKETESGLKRTSFPLKGKFVVK